MGSCSGPPRYADSDEACATTSGRPVPRERDPRTPDRALLRCGAIGAPLFVVIFLIEDAVPAIRPPGYNPIRHPVSSLAIGQHGWIQVANFLATGVLLLAFSVGLRRYHGEFWAPVQVGLVAIGLIGAGVFTADPLSGYPPGTPAVPVGAARAAHGVLHRRFRPWSSWDCRPRAAWSATGSPDPGADGGPATRARPPRCSSPVLSWRTWRLRSTPHSCRSADCSNVSP